MARKVTVASAAANRAKAFMTNATTWAQLKEEIIGQGLSLDNVEAVMAPGNVTLSQPESVLATTDFNVYLIPTKNKAGMPLSDSDIQDIINALKTASSVAEQQKGVSLKQALINTVEEYFDVDLDDIRESGTSEYAEDLRRAQQMAGNNW